MAIEIPNPIAIIVANLQVGPAIVTGQQYLATTLPVERVGAGDYRVQLAEALPVVQSPYQQDCAVLASVQGVASTAAADGRVVEAIPDATVQGRIRVTVRSAVTGALADDAAVSLIVFRQPNAS